MERIGARRNCISTTIPGPAFDSARWLWADALRLSVGYLLPKTISSVKQLATQLGPALTIRFSILDLISRARVKKASSTFMLFFADVSRNLIPYYKKTRWTKVPSLSKPHAFTSMANCSPRSFVTWRFSFSSHLLPRSIFSTSVDAFSSMLRIQFFMFSKDFSCVMSYT